MLAGLHQLSGRSPSTHVDNTLPLQLLADHGSLNGNPGLPSSLQKGLLNGTHYGSLQVSVQYYMRVITLLSYSVHI